MFQKPVFGRKGMKAVVQQAAEFMSAEELPDLGGLTAELKRCDAIAFGMGRKALRYVATGSPGGLPDQISAQLLQIGRYKSEYHNDSVAKSDAQTQSDMAIAKGDITDVAVLSRFIAMRLALDPWPAYFSLSNPKPPEDEKPVRAFMSAVWQGSRSLNKDVPDESKPFVPLLPPRSVLRLAEQLGGNPSLYFQLTATGSGQIFSSRDDFRAEYLSLVTEHVKEFAQSIVARETDQSRCLMIRFAEGLGVMALPPVMATLFSLMGKGNKREVREQAIGSLSRLDPEILPKALELSFAQGELEMRYDLVQIVMKAGSDAALDVVRAHLPKERSAKVEGAIKAILESHEAVTSEPVSQDAADPTQAQKIKLANGEVYELEWFDQTLLDPLTDGDKTDFLRLVGIVNGFRAKVRKDCAEKSKDFLAPYQEISESDADGLFAFLQGDPRTGEGLRHLNFRLDLRPQNANDDLTDWLDKSSPKLRWRLFAKLTGAIRFKEFLEPRYFDKTIVDESVLKDVVQGHDVLSLSALFARSPVKTTGPFTHIGAFRTWLAPYRRYYGQWQNPLEKLPASAAQRMVAASVEVFDEVFGLSQANGELSTTQACKMLAMLPAVPERYVAKLVELGLTGKRDEREATQEVLHSAQGIVTRLEDALDDRRQDVRAHAATWLADMQSESSEKPLRKRLKKEKAEVVRAALIEALLRLGADLSDVIGPQALMAEAEKKGRKLALPEWVNPETLPQVRFADGASAPRALIEYWIGLAVKLKDPSNTGLFGIYLDQLLPQDSAQLSGHILEGWINFDTHGPTLEEANAYAQSRVDSSRRAHRQGGWNSLGSTPADVEDKLAQIFAYYKREKLNQLPNTGTKSKGALALACRAEASFAAERVRWFLKNHGRRSHQAMALLDMLVGIGTPTAMQVVISAATRLKQKSTMAHANNIAERYAKDRGWSYDELADRTVPTASFDDAGELDLPCGPDAKPYVARIDEQLAIHIFNPAGKVIKALPSGDDEDTKESKKTLAASKRELKQIIAMQTQRMFEAIAAERHWPVDDWIECFHGHPVMRRLIERLVWEGLDAHNNPQGLFRATQEGDFTNAQDEGIDVRDYATVRLSHAALVDESTAEAWQAHLKDYEIKPLIDQFPKGYKPYGGCEADATAISDRHGWLGETRPYRGAAEKLGYQREMGDGGGVSGFYKDFQAAGITAFIETYGGLAYDENDPQSLKDLIFRKTGSYGGLALKDVPPALLAMCHADLHTIAKKGAFNEEWEAKSGW